MNCCKEATSIMLSTFYTSSHAAKLGFFSFLQHAKIKLFMKLFMIERSQRVLDT